MSKNDSRSSASKARTNAAIESLGPYIRHKNSWLVSDSELRTAWKKANELRIDGPVAARWWAPYRATLKLHQEAMKDNYLKVLVPQPKTQIFSELIFPSRARILLKRERRELVLKGYELEPWLASELYCRVMVNYRRYRNWRESKYFKGGAEVGLQHIQRHLVLLGEELDRLKAQNVLSHERAHHDQVKNRVIQEKIKLAMEEWKAELKRERERYDDLLGKSSLLVVSLSHERLIIE